MSVGTQGVVFITLPYFEGNKGIITYIIFEGLTLSTRIGKVPVIS